MKYYLIFLFTILLSTSWSDDYSSISTSRPGVYNPTSSVPKGLYQLEVGTNLSTGPGMDTLLTMPVLLRLGVINNTELQVAYASKYLTLGVLYGGINLINGLENSIIFSTSLTENNDELTEYNVYLPITYSFNNGFFIGAHLNSTIFNNDSDDPLISYAIAIGNSLNDKTSWFFEHYHTLDNDENPPFSIDYGISYLSDTNVQFDISMGLTFEKINDKYKESERFIEWGFSFRLPN